MYPYCTCTYRYVQVRMYSYTIYLFTIIYHIIIAMASSVSEGDQDGHEETGIQKTPTVQAEAKQIQTPLQDISPYDKANLFSRLFFGYAFPVFRLFLRTGHDLSLKSIPPCPQQDNAVDQVYANRDPSSKQCNELCRFPPYHALNSVNSVLQP